MAKVIIRKYVNQTEDTPASGKTYGRVAYIETISTRQLANHMSDHGSIYTSDLALGFLEKLRKCIVEMCLDSKKVKLEGLGTFYIGAVSTGETDGKDFTAGNIKALKLKFLPDQSNEFALNSRELRARASLLGVAELTGESGGSSSGGGGSVTPVTPEP